MPIADQPILNNLFIKMRERITSVWPEVVKQPDDPQRVRGILSLDEMMDVSFELIEAPYAVIYTNGFYRDPISAMDAQSWICIMEIIYVRSADQSTEEMMEKAMQLQIFLETYPNDDLEGVGQVGRVHTITNSPSSMGNDQFIVRRLPNRAVVLQAEIWIVHDPIPLPIGAGS